MPDVYGPYNELIGGRSPNPTGFSRQGGGRSVHKIIIGDKGDSANSITSVTQINAAIQEILGYTMIAPDGINLNRVLPKAHPMYPWLFAERISEIVGIGRMSKSEASPYGNLGADPLDYVAFYPAYELTVEFLPRPYPLATDDEIATSGGTLTWTEQDGTTVNSNVAYSAEYLRYVDVERLPAGQYITAQAGQFQFDVASGLKPNTYQAGAGQVRMFLKESGIKMTWYEVPYSYVDRIGVSSYIEDGLGCVNYSDFLGYPAGTLLLQAVQVTRYTPPVPRSVYWQDTTIYTGEKFCDIQFIFIFKNPPLGLDSNNVTATPSAAANNNVKQAGHNLVPYAHNASFYFAKTTGISGFTNANNRPIFPSFPMQLLFTNPGVT